MPTGFFVRLHPMRTQQTAEFTARKLLFALLMPLAVSLLPSCRNTKSSTTTDVATTLSQVQPVLLQPELAHSPDVSVVSARLDGGILQLELTCPGACPDQRIELVHSGMMTKSLPPQLPMWLHRAAPATCSGSARLTRRYDVSALLRPNMDVVLQVRGYGERILLPRSEPKPMKSTN